MSRMLSAQISEAYAMPLLPPKKSITIMLARTLLDRINANVSRLHSILFRNRNTNRRDLCTNYHWFPVTFKQKGVKRCSHSRTIMHRSNRTLPHYVYHCTLHQSNRTLLHYVNHCTVNTSSMCYHNNKTFSHYVNHCTVNTTSFHAPQNALLLNTPVSISFKPSLIAILQSVYHSSLRS